MAESFDAGAFVINKDAGSQSAASTTLLSVAPCDLDIASFAVYQTATTTTPSSFNIKVTPPVAPAVYARSYNYNYATAKNTQITSISSDLTTLTFTVSGASTLAAGDVITVTGSTLPFWNLKDATIASVSQTNGLTTSFTVKYPEATATSTHPGSKVALANVNTTNPSTGVVKYTTAISHGLKTGDLVTVGGTTTGANDIGTATAVTVLTATTFTVASSNTVGAVGASGYINITAVSNGANPIVVTKGQVVDAVQLVTDPDVNRAADYTLSSTPYYAYVSDQVLPIGVKGAQFPAPALGNGNDSRLAGKIPAGSKVEIEMLVAGATVAGLTYSIEFKKK